MVDQWMRDLVLTALREQSYVGDAMGEGTLRETTGLGENDLRLVLDELRQEGCVAESAPGLWELVGEGSPQADEPALEPPAEQPGAAPERAGLPRPLPGALKPQPPQEMRLSRAMVEALDDPEAVGRLVLAGITSCRGEFVLRVTA